MDLVLLPLSSIPSSFPFFAGCFHVPIRPLFAGCLRYRKDDTAPPSTKKLGDLAVDSAPVDRLGTLIHLFPFLLLLFALLWPSTVSTTRTPPPPLQPRNLAIWPRVSHIVREVGAVGMRSSKLWNMGCLEVSSSFRYL